MGGSNYEQKITFCGKQSNNILRKEVQIDNPNEIISFRSIAFSFPDKLLGGIKRTCSQKKSLHGLILSNLNCHQCKKNKIYDQLE